MRCAVGHRSRRAQPRCWRLQQRRAPTLTRAAARGSSGWKCSTHSARGAHASRARRRRRRALGVGLGVGRGRRCCARWTTRTRWSCSRRSTEPPQRQHVRHHSLVPSPLFLLVMAPACLFSSLTLGSNGLGAGAAARGLSQPSPDASPQPRQGDRGGSGGTQSRRGTPRLSVDNFRLLPGVASSVFCGTHFCRERLRALG